MINSGSPSCGAMFRTDTADHQPRQFSARAAAPIGCPLTTRA
jgi:hypothetical protein